MRDPQEYLPPDPWYVTLGRLVVGLVVVGAIWGGVGVLLFAVYNLTH